MENTKTILWLFIFTFAASMMTACAQSSNDGAVGGNGNALVPGPSNFAAKLGFFAQNQLMTSYNGNNQGTSFTMSNGSAAKVLLTNIMGVCDRNAIDGGLADCSAWLGGYQDMMLFSNGSQASSLRLVIRAYPYQYGNSTYYYSFPTLKQFLLSTLGFNTMNGAARYNPLVLDTNIWPTEADQGFELRANAPAGATYGGGVNKVIHFAVERGKLEDQSWNFKIYLDYDPINQLVASGRATRCMTPNCGVSGF